MAVSKREMQDLYDDSPKPAGAISKTSQKFLDHFNVLNESFLGALKNDFDSMNKTYSSLDFKLDSCARAFEGISSEFQSLSNNYSRSDDSKKDSLLSRLWPFKRKAIGKSKPLDARANYQSLLSKVNGEIDYLKKLEEESSEIFDFEHNISVLRNGYSTEFKFPKDNVSDLSLEYLRQMLEWGIDANSDPKEALSRVEALMTVKGERFIQKNLKDRSYSRRRNYFEQAYKKWRNLFSDEQIKDILETARQYRVVSRINARIAKSRKEIEKYEGSLNKLKSQISYLISVS